MEEDYNVHPTAIVEDDVDIGNNTNVWHFAHVRERAEIGEKCNLGKDVYIDSEVSIGNNVKIQNGVSVYKGVTVKDDVFLGPHMTFTNDRYPRATDDGWDVVSTLVKKGASIGAHATIISGVEIGKYAMVGAGAVVTKDVPDFGLVLGNPAELHGFVCYCGHKLSDVVKEKEDVVELECPECGKSVKIRQKLFNKCFSGD